MVSVERMGSKKMIEIAIISVFFMYVVGAKIYSAGKKINDPEF